MSVFFRRTQRDASFPTSIIPSRSRVSYGRASVTADSAMRQSAVWAAIRLRADLISTLPVDVYRRVDGVQIEVPKPAVLINPGGQRVSMREWLYSSQVDLDRVGNCYGIIAEKDGAGRPARINLVQHDTVTVKVKDDVVTYVIKNTTYSEDEIWHERQYTVPGLVVGLSPISYAAWSAGLYSSAQSFAETWFRNNGITPSGHLKNEEKTLTDADADKIKERFKIAVEGSDLFVTGKDWSYTTGLTAAADAKFLEQMDHTDVDIARFFSVPGDLIEAHKSGSSVTYANITQRNLQFLIMNLGPAVIRREEALSLLLAPPRFVKLNTAAMLRMDPAATSAMLAAEVAGRITAPSEARALMNRAPFTPEQLAEFETLFPQKAQKTGVTA